jgi:primosomal protein N' (replication factor Y)
MIVHTSPSRKLLCHHCSTESAIPHSCTKCHGSNLNSIGFWIQKIEEHIQKLFPHTPIARIDSDKKRAEWIVFQEIQEAKILLSTELWNTISLDNIELVAFLLLESEIAVPEYDIEEKIYTNITYNARKWSEIFIQTFAPKSDLVKNITAGNYRDFLIHTLKERKAFSYPPYKELVHIWVRDKSKERIKEIIYKLKNKLEILKTPLIELYFDKELFTKRNNEFGQKIVLKWDDLSPLLKEVEKEIFRNHGVSLERK